MTEGFLLSIIIPTKNRQAYAVKVVEQILQINDYRIQVVIQDNSDDNHLFELLSRYNDDIRYKYNYTKGIISFVDNFSLAVKLADGEYVSIIGDDDGIVPYIADVVSWARLNHIDAVKPELLAVYYWPNSESIQDSLDNGYLHIKEMTIRTRIADPRQAVKKLLNQGCQNYLSLDLVKLYHGVVRKDCLETIKSKTGKYFGGLSPDIYISMALSQMIDRVLVTDFPLTISGICNRSGSADSATGRHTGQLEDAPHFRGHNSYQWSELVPKFYSVETIWADSALAALQDLNYLDDLKYFNLGELATICLKKYPKYNNIIIKHYTDLLKKNQRSRLIFEFRRSSDLVKTFIRKVMKKLFNRRKKPVEKYGINDIVEATQYLQKVLFDTGINKQSIELSLNKLL